MEKYRNSKKSVDRVIGKQKTDLPIIEVAQRFKSLRAKGLFGQQLEASNIKIIVKDTDHASSHRNEKVRA